MSVTLEGSFPPLPLYEDPGEAELEVGKLRLTTGAAEERRRELCLRTGNRLGERNVVQRYRMAVCLCLRPADANRILCLCFLSRSEEKDWVHGS